MALKQGIVAHLFCGSEILLILRNNANGHVVDPWHWDSLTETMEPEDDGDPTKTAHRGLIEEISFVPQNLRFLGITRAGHGFFVGFLTDRESQSIVLDPSEGENFGFYSLEDVFRLKLGGAIRYHSEAYPMAFEKMARGKIPELTELGLRLPIQLQKVV